MRGVGVTGALTDAVPHALLPVLEVLTQLGDAWLVLVAVASVHWLAPRYGLIDERDALRYVALGIAIFGTVVGLKAVFALGRPPTSVALVADDGYGFPSGHAVSAAALYAGAAALFARPSRRWRWLVATGLVALVCATRLLLGVHYLVDVVAGVVAGAVLVGVVLTVTRERLLPGYAFAAALGVFALGVAGPTVEALAACGLGVGALGSIVAATRRSTVVRGPVRPLVASCGYVVVGALALAALKAPLPEYGVVLTSSVAGAGVVALPAIPSTLQNFSR